MSTFKYLLAAAAVLCLLPQTSACSCAPPGTLCDSILRTEVVLHVKALERTDGADINDDAVYTLETIQVFKGEEPGPNEYDEVGGTFEMTTGGNSALCGVFLSTDGTEYLIGMSRLSDGVLYAAGICGLIQEWNEEDRATLEEGCDDYDPCDGECGEFQECVRSYDYYAEDSYYCQDTCDPSPCLDGEACTLVYPLCSGGGCVAEASCGEAQSPSPSLPPAGTFPPGGFVDSARTLPPGATIDSTTSRSYVETLAPSGGSLGPPIEEDSRDADEPATPPPAPGTVGPPSSTPQTPAPTRDERSPPAAAPTWPPRGDGPTAPDSSESPAPGRDSPTAAASPTGSDGDGSPGGSTPTTAAPSMAPASGAGGASPLPEVSSAPTVSANAEGDDTGAAPAVRSSGGFVAATAAAVVIATAAAACASL